MIIIIIRVKHMNFSRQRNLIQETLRANPVHPTADELLALVRKGDASVGLATVYRNLKTLSQDGAILRIQAIGAERFDGNTSPHYHMQCDSCGRVYDLPGDAEPDFTAITQNTRHRITGASILFTGTCEGCLKKTQS